MKKCCTICNAEFEAKYNYAKYCGSKCRKENDSRRRKKTDWNKTCVICDKEYQSKARSVTCSIECRTIRKNKLRKNTTTKTCICGKEFSGLGNRKYCSDTCSNEVIKINSSKKKKHDDYKSITKTCELCGESFTGHCNSKFCSKMCRKKVDAKRNAKRYKDKRKIIQCECKICGNTFVKRNAQITCSEECRVIRNQNNQSRWRKDNAAWLKEYKKLNPNKPKDPNRIRMLREAKLPPIVEIKCKECKEYFTPKTRAKHITFCSNLCKVRWWTKEPKTNLCTRIRNGLHKCMNDRGIKKQNSTFDYLDFTPEELLSHIESQFTDGMSWDNKGEWHVDHIRPIASFNFDSTEHPEFKECWALENLQPMWGSDNCSKGSLWEGKRKHKVIQ